MTNESYRPVLSKIARRLWISFGIVVVVLMGYKQGISQFEDRKTVIDSKSPDSAAMFYVALEGDDRNPGTISKPWGTIQRAARSAKAGDTVLIRKGLYAIKDPIRPANQVHSFYSPFSDNPVFTGSPTTSEYTSCSSTAVSVGAASSGAFPAGLA